MIWEDIAVQLESKMAEKQVEAILTSYQDKTGITIKL